MPIPVLALLALGAKALAAAKTGAIVLKTGAVAAKGATVLGKVLAVKSGAATHALVHAARVYGTAKVLTVAAIATLSVGAATIIYEKAQRLLTALDGDDPGEKLLAASTLFNEVSGLGGLRDVSTVLDRFIAEGGTVAATVQEVTEQVSGLLHALTSRLNIAK